jgi:hypothetical protein
MTAERDVTSYGAAQDVKLTLGFDSQTVLCLDRPGLCRIHKEVVFGYRKHKEVNDI